MRATFFVSICLVAGCGLSSDQPASVAAPATGERPASKSTVFADKSLPPSERLNALDAIGQAGKPDADAVSAMVQLLGDAKEGEQVREKAAQTLRKIRATKPAADQLTTITLDRGASEQVRLGALGGLRRLGAAGLPGILKSMHAISGFPREELKAFRLPEGDPAVEETAAILAESLEKPVRDPVDAYLDPTAEALGRLGPRVLPTIRKLLVHRIATTRANALRAAAQMKADARGAVPDIVKILKSDPERDVVNFAAVALGEIGPDAKPAYSELVTIAIVRRQDERNAIQAAVAAAKIDPTNMTSWEALSSAIKVSESAEAVAALRLLDKKLDYLAVSTLGECLDLHNRYAAGEAYRILLERHRKAAVDVFGRVVLNRDTQVVTRALALRGLASLGPDAEAALPAVRVALNNEFGEIRVPAALALAKIGKNPDPAVQTLITALGDKSNDVVAAAVEALEEIGPPAKGAIPALVALKRRSNQSSLSEKIDRALNKIDPHQFPDKP